MNTISDHLKRSRHAPFIGERSPHLEPKEIREN